MTRDNEVDNTKSALSTILKWLGKHPDNENCQVHRWQGLTLLQHNNLRPNRIIERFCKSDPEFSCIDQRTRQYCFLVAFATNDSKVIVPTSDSA
jgi:hypothetical protein